MKKTLFFALSVVGIALVFQACPSSHGHQFGNDGVSTRGQAAILTLEDTVQIRYRDDNQVYRTEELYPSPYIQMVGWVEVVADEELTEEQHQQRKLRVKKLTNHGTAYVINGSFCYVNGENCSFYYTYRNPADTIRTYYQFGELVEQKIPLHPQPCELGQIIDAYLEQYPDRITVLDDNEYHYIGSLIYDEDGGNVTRLSIDL